MVGETGKKAGLMPSAHKDPPRFLPTWLYFVVPFWSSSDCLEWLSWVSVLQDGGLNVLTLIYFLFFPDDF